MVPDAVGGEQRDVRQVTHPVVRHSRKRRGLPARLRVDQALAAAASHHVLVHQALGRVVAVLDRTGSAIELPDDRVRAVVVPGDLGDVGKRRSARAAVLGSPEAAVLAKCGVLEVGAADRGVVGIRCEAVHGEAGGGIGRPVVAAGGRAVARGNEHRDALGRPLLDQLFPRLQERQAVALFAAAIGDGDRRRRRADLDQVLQRDHHPEIELGPSTRAGGQHDLRIRRGGARPFGVDRRLAFVGGAAGILAAPGMGDAEAALVAGQLEGRAEAVPVRRQDVGLLGDHDGLPGAGDLLPQYR